MLFWGLTRYRYGLSTRVTTISPLARTAKFSRWASTSTWMILLTVGVTELDVEDCEVSREDGDLSTSVDAPRARSVADISVSARGRYMLVRFDHLGNKYNQLVLAFERAAIDISVDDIAEPAVTLVYFT